jgi:hypothetical protein
MCDGGVGVCTLWVCMLFGAAVSTAHAHAVVPAQAVAQQPD